MTTFQKVLRRIIPPPRRPVTWRQSVPLCIFLLLFAAIIVGLVATSRVEFDYPWAFLLMIVSPWIWWMQAAGYSGLPRRRATAALITRLVLLGLLVSVLAQPRAVKTSNLVSVVFDVDVSDSVGPDAREDALAIVAGAVAEKPGRDEAGLVIFGRTPAVEYPPRESMPFEKYLNSQVGKDATNIEQSLSLSAAMLPEENRSRVVLISDGTETRGAVKNAVTELQARDIQVDVIPVTQTDRLEHEVLLERLDLPRHVHRGETYEAATILSSLKDGRGVLVLSQNGEELTRQEVTFRAGKNRIAIPINIDAPGYYAYEARIEVPATEDACLENNAVRNYLYIEGPGRILIVTDPAGDPREWQFVRQALQQGKRQVDTMTATEFPLDPLALMPYDVVMFANVPADTLFAAQIQAMHDAVRNLGIGFVMLGGPNSFGPGGYQNSPIEDCLPVSMEISKKKVLPKGALVIILHTCEFPQGNSWAKRITKQAIRVLNAEDEVGAIGYGPNGNEWIFELTPAEKYAQLVPKINGAQIGDMPDFTSTMEMGLKGLLKSDAASRHMIIISDGDPPMPPPATIKKFQDSDTSISTVAIYPHGGRDTMVLNAIASQTGGRYYFPSNPAQLPSIFIKEAKTLRRNQVQERTFTPRLLNSDSLFRDISELPPLHGYVLTSEKDDPRATVLLSAPPAGDDPVASDSDVDPILAIWRYGLGVSAAFTSDLTDDWGRDWVRWSQFQQILTQLITRVSRVSEDQYLRLYTYVNGNEGVIVVEDFHPEESLLDMRFQVKSGDNFAESGQVRQIAPRRYQASVPLEGQGRYQVRITANRPGRDKAEEVYGGFIVSYSPEYLRFESNPIALREIAEKTGGVELDPSLPPAELTKIIYGRRQEKRSSRPIFDWLLMALVCLIPLDVAVRRVQLDFSWVARLFGRQRSTESTATIGTLLEKTQSVRAGLKPDQRPAVRPAPASNTVRPPRDVPPVRPTTNDDKATPGTTQPAQQAPKTEEPQEASSTTSRLLAMKRQREQEKNQS